MSRTSILQRSAIILVGLFLSGCEAISYNHGYIPDEDIVVNLEQQGQISQQQVIAQLGKPVLVDPDTSQENWFYIAYTKEEFAFLEPRIVSQDVLAISFDQDKKVEEIRKYNIADGQIIDLDTGKTPTYGRQLNVLQQFLGNLGRFNNQNNSPVVGSGGVGGVSRR